jgi:hypothetical protein
MILDKVNDKGFARACRACQQKGLSEASQIGGRLLLFRQCLLGLVKVKDRRHGLGRKLGDQIEVAHSKVGYKKRQGVNESVCQIKNIIFQFNK